MLRNATRDTVHYHNVKHGQGPLADIILNTSHSLRSISPPASSLRVPTKQLIASFPLSERKRQFTCLKLPLKQAICNTAVLAVDDAAERCGYTTVNQTDDYHFRGSAIGMNDMISIPQGRCELPGGFAFRQDLQRVCSTAP